MAGTLVKSVMLKIVSDDGDSEVKLDRISAKADELGRKHPDLRPRIDTAAASAKLRVLRDELRATAKEERKVGRDAREAAGENALGLLKTSLLGLAPAALPILAATGAGVVALGASLAAAGTGLGAFGLVAKSVWTQASTAAAAYAAAQEKLALASTKAQRVSALKAERAALYGLSAPVKSLTVDVAHARGEWKHFTDAAAPGVVRVISQGLHLLPAALARMKPFLAPAEHALSGLVSSLSHGLSSKGFKSFTSMLASQTGPAITAIGTAIGHLVSGLGHLLAGVAPFGRTMLGTLDAVTAKFSAWASSTRASRGIEHLFGYVRANAGAVVRVFTQIGRELPKIVTALAGFGGGALSGVSVILSVIGKLSPGELQGIALGIGAISLATKGWKLAQDGLNLVMDASPIGIVVTVLGALGVAVVELWHRSAAFRTFWRHAWADVKTIAVGAFHLITHTVSVFVHSWVHDWETVKHGALATWHFLDNDVIHPIERAVAGVVNWIRGHWRLLPAIFGGPIGIVVSLVLTHWHQIEHGTQHLVSAVTGFFRGLPHRILGALGNVGRLLWNAGADIVRGLIGGLESMGGSLISAGEHLGSSVVGAVKGFLHIGSPSLVFADIGHNIGAGLVMGMAGHTGAVSTAARGLATAAAGAARGYGGGPLPGGTRTYNISVSVPPTANLADTGRVVVEAIREFERDSGPGWRA